MQKFLISVFGAWGLSLVLFLLYASKNAGGTLISDFLFVFFLFFLLSFSLSLIFYAGRFLFTKLLLKNKTQGEESKDLRSVWRAYFKASLFISFLLSAIAFMKLEEQLNTFNLFVLITIIVVFSIWLKMKS